LYPVVVYLHSIYGKAEWIVSNGAKRLSERAFSKGVTGEFILVIPDCSSSNIGSLYENSPVSGRWLDYITKEVIPFIDKRYRTIRKRESRAVIGDFMGGRGALQLGMSHADLFSVVYAMHPVATGVGPRPWTELGINWQKILKAKTFADLGGDKPCETFVAICQAFLPNPNRPPFYCDYFMKQDSVGLQVDAANMIKIQRAFMLEQRLGESVGNLQKLRALAFDWARNDGNYDHVHSARKFTRDLEDLGIEHEAEEYRGTPWNNTWNDDGRFYMRVLPFLGRHLVFE
jgi:S-formylglutathione hydrolase FrmB